MNKVWPHATPGEFQKAALFLRLGLPSTLIRHENRTFEKRSSNRRNLKTPTLRFSVGGKHFENGAFQKRCCDGNHMISLTEINSTSNLNWSVIVALSNFSGVVWVENIWCAFRVEPPFLNSSSVVRRGLRCVQAKQANFLPKSSLAIACHATVSFVWNN